jgi:hypothetical protein
MTDPLTCLQCSETGHDEIPSARDSSHGLSVVFQEDDANLAIVRQCSSLSGIDGRWQHSRDVHLSYSSQISVSVIEHVT